MDVRRALRDRRHARLLQKARRGNRKAFLSLYNDLHTPIFQYLDRRLSDIHDTEDLTSTVFHKFLGSLDRFDPGRGSVTAWLMTMARHCLIDHLRRRRNTVDMDEVADFLAGPTCDPLAGMIRTEEAEQIRTELEMLPTGTREIVALRYGEGLRCREIALITGLSEAAVKQRLSRTVRHLRRRLSEEPETEGEVEYATR